MDYIKLFDLNSEYSNYIELEDALLPNVSFVQETSKVFFNPIKKQINYFGFTAIEDSTIIITTQNSDESFDTTLNLEYSKDGNIWTTWDYSNIQLLMGESVYLRGNNPNGFTSFEPNTIIYSFGMSTGKYNVHGNIMSLLYGDDFEDKYTIPNQYCFNGLFSTMSENANTSLVNACDLILPANILTHGCYYSMFSNCTSLITAPALPATTLTDYCYTGMFYGCTSLTTAPELPATTLTVYCYGSMFKDCTNLNQITMLATDITATDCLSIWVNGVSSMGTFTKAPGVEIPTATEDNNYTGIPEGWTVQDAA